MQFINKTKQCILKYKIQKNRPIKIVAGAGHTKFDGWLNTDVHELDITKKDDFDFIFGNKKIKNILLEHVIEHLEYDDFLEFLSIVKQYLTNDGVIRVAVPDANHPSAYVRKLTGKHGSEPGADNHKIFYSVSDFEKIAIKLGYKIKRLEYFDSEGVFHMSNYNFENGYISRCSKNYKGRFTNDKEEYEKMIQSVPTHLRKQFETNKISYTSLLVDFYND